MDFIYTRYQIPRGAKPDAKVGHKLYLIKNVTQLRLTYQIRMLTYMAQIQGNKLIVQLPKGAKIHNVLREFVRSMPRYIVIERV